MEIKVPDVLPKRDYLKLPPSERELYVREILRQTVRRNEHGVTASLLAKNLSFDSRTIEKHLSILIYTNEIYSLKIGNTHLYLPNSIPIHPAKKKTFETSNKEYAAYALQNRFGKFVFLQEIKKTEFAEEVGGGILIPLTDFNRFVDFLIDFKKEVNRLIGG